MFRKHPNIALVLMDIKLPGMDGLEATEEIRKLNTRVPIIAQTAFAFAGDRQSALRAGCNDYMAKPIDGEFLIEKIKQYLDLYE
jgi:CheY-like chemotaxis protein